MVQRLLSAMTINQALPLVKETKEIKIQTLDDLEPAVELINTGHWIAIGAAGSKKTNGYLLCLGRV